MRTQPKEPGHRQSASVAGFVLFFLLTALLLGGCLDDDDSDDAPDDVVENGNDNGDDDNGDNGDNGEGDDGVPVGELGERVQDYLAEEFGGHDADPCFAVGRITSEGEEIGIACTNPEDAEAISPENTFQIASITKPLLGTSVLHAQQTLDFELEDPVEELLRDEAEVLRYDGDEPITVKELLTHSSGLERWPFSGYDPDDPYAELDESVVLDFADDEEEPFVEFEVDPGQYQYSNYGTMLLTLALHDADGRDFDDILAEAVLEPADMEHAGLEAPDVQGHTSDGEPTPPWSFHTNVAGIGGLSASLEDMLNLLDAKLSAPEDGNLELLHDAQKELAAPEEPDSDGEGVPMGALWQRTEEAWYDESQVVLSHAGTAGGFHSLVIFEKEGDRAVVVLSDTFDLTDDIPMEQVAELGTELLTPEDADVDTAPAIEMIQPTEPGLGVGQVESELPED